MDLEWIRENKEVWHHKCRNGLSVDTSDADGRGFGEGVAGSATFVEFDGGV